MHLGALALTVCLLALSAFFVLVEFSIVRVRVTQLEALLGKDPRARLALDVQHRLNEYLSSVLLGITLCAIAFGAVGEDLFVQPIFRSMGWLPWKGLVKPLASAVALIVMTTIHVVLTEMLPRSFAIRAATTWSLRTARPLQLWAGIAHPLTWSLMKLGRVGERLLGLPAEDQDQADAIPTEAEFRRMLVKSQEKGQLKLSRKELIENVFEFSKRTVNEVAVPRNQVVVFDLQRSLADNLRLARTTPHTRIPAVEGDLDHVVGIIHIKELLWALHEQGERLDLRALARPAFFVPEMRGIQDLLLDFQRRKQHVALVVNEHGGIDGLVTMEDVLEELVGEIQDEFDREAIQLEKTRGGAWLAQGTLTLEQLEDHLELKLEVPEGIISLGGYFQERLGRVLRLGDELRIQGWRIRVLAMRGMAPSKFLLRPIGELETGNAGEDPDDPGR